MHDQYFPQITPISAVVVVPGRILSRRPSAKKLWQSMVYYVDEICADQRAI